MAEPPSDSKEKKLTQQSEYKFFSPDLFEGRRGQFQKYMGVAFSLFVRMMDSMRMRRADRNGTITYDTVGGERRVRGGRGHRGASYVEKRGRCLNEEEHRPGGKRKINKQKQRKKQKRNPAVGPRPAPASHLLLALKYYNMGLVVCFGHVSPPRNPSQYR